MTVSVERLYTSICSTIRGLGVLTKDPQTPLNDNIESS